HPIHLSKFMTIAICALIFKPIYLLHLADSHISVTLVSDRTVIVKSVTQLGIAPNHLCRFYMNFRWCIMASTSLFGNFRTWNLNMFILSMIHKHRSLWHTVTYDRSSRYNTVAVIYF